MFNVLKQGILTSVQDATGRRGFAHLGFPPSGAMDPLALKVGNFLVGNDLNEAGLEFAFQGPELMFMDDALVAVTGAVTIPKLNGEPMPMWTSILVRKGQTLSVTAMSSAGQWGYICISGGIDVPKVMNSKSTFAAVSLGGYHGRYLKNGDVVDTGKVKSLDREGKKLKACYVPTITDPMVVELMHGYFTDYLSEDDMKKMYSALWTVQSNSSRLGYRLEGPEFEFSHKAHNKSAAAGAFPSNIFDSGYPVGAINLAGQTPIILTVDGPTCGGYMCPFCVASAAQWKLGQCRIGAKIQFKFIDMEKATDLKKEMEKYYQEDYYTN